MLSKIMPGFLALALVLLLSACAGNQAAIPDTPTVGQISTTPTLTEPHPTETPPPTTAPATATTVVEALPPIPSGCTVVTQQYSPEPTQQSIFPQVTSADWIIGPETAAVTLVEYSDFQ